MEKPLSYYFKAPYAALITSGLLLGEYDAEGIASKLTTNPALLFQEGFLSDYQNGLPEWDAALTENSIHDWNISVPSLITHNISDEVSPYFNSEALANLNASNPQVIFEPIPNTNHFDGIFTWVL